jgi:hypothetical protein
MNQKDIDVMIASFVEEEKNSSYNPFLATRIMALLNSDIRDRKIFFSVRQKVAIAFSLVIAIVFGIAAGNLYKPASIHNDQTTVMLVNDEKLEHFIFYQEVQKNE